MMSLITATEYQSLHLFSKPVILGSVLVAIGQETWLRDQDVDALQYRDKVLAEPVGFD